MKIYCSFYLPMHPSYIVVNWNSKIYRFLLKIYKKSLVLSRIYNLNIYFVSFIVNKQFSLTFSVVYQTKNVYIRKPKNEFPSRRKCRKRWKKENSMSGFSTRLAREIQKEGMCEWEALMLFNEVIQKTLFFFLFLKTSQTRHANVCSFDRKHLW